MSGMFLLSTAVLNPVLLYGVSPKDVSTSTAVETESSEDPFSGFIATSGAIYTADDPVTIGTLLHLKNISVPSTSLCSQPSCSIKARSTALQAKCVATSAVWEPPFFASEDQIKLSGGPFEHPLHCSRYGNDTCVLMQNLADKDFPVITHVNFTLGPSTVCGTRLSRMMDERLEIEQLECPAGDFAVLVGVWYANSVQGSRPNATSKLWHTVDCQIQYGTVSIQQSGSDVPELDRNSFVKSTTPLVMVGDPFSSDGNGFAATPPDYQSSKPFLWQTTYLSKAVYGRSGVTPPFKFAVVGDKVEGSLTLAQALLGVPSIGDYPAVPLTTNKDDAEAVAKDLEASFDAATLLAFVQAPYAASLNITTDTHSSRWAYDARVLPVLTIPLLAILLVCSVYWKVYGDEIVIGYHPLEIARRADEITVASQQVDYEGVSDCEAIQLTTGGGTYNKLNAQVSE